MATIITKNSSTASSVPLAAQLVQGELAVNVTDKRLFTENNGGTVVELGTNPSSLSTGALAYTGTLTGGTGVVNLGSGQVYKDASGNVGIGTSSPFSNVAYNSLTVGGLKRGILTLNNASGTNVCQMFVDSADLTNLYSTTSIILGSASGANLLTYNSSGNLGLGVTPSAWVSGDTILQVKAGSSITSLWGRNASGRLISNAYYDGTNYKYYATGTATSFETNVGGGYNWNIAASGTAGNAITFTQAMTLDSSGNLLVGTTSNIGAVSGRLNVKQSASANCANFQNGNDAGWGIAFYNVAGTLAGSISWTATTTTYTTSSDYRLKEAIAPMTGALAKVALLKPVTYKWKVDGSDGQGFIAHELAEVEAGCVTGEKDAVDADGKPKYQGIDTSFLVATLAAAIQELKAIVDAQGAEIAALKSI